ncbi:shikimate dehydrogenase [Prosthecobacter fusiformis]|uniref:shikimate dehydrogenase n=1 Tax=Prosthecobacter fusiformis TaxID=48464 RepID=UPI001414DD72|nr:shikimate dehydrogenase [Prosthecobacter fusiformis]
MASFFSYDQLQHWADVASALDVPARLAVIGDPIGHSKSPQMHNPALRACGMDAQYVRIQVPVGHVKEAFGLFVKNGFVGVNITIPHKFEALDAVDVVDPLARRLGAVNTLAIRDGKMHGFNTDGPGFLSSVKEAFNADVKDLRILILGAGGGAGRAVAVQSVLAGCRHLLLATRTESKLVPLMQELATIPDSTTQLSVCTLDHDDLARQLQNVDLIVNATSLGMKAEDELLLPTSCLEARHFVYDMVYRASGPTELIQAATAAGARHADGMSLLLHQGAISFEHWFPGVTAPLEAMRAGLAAASV